MLSKTMESRTAVTDSRQPATKLEKLGMPAIILCLIAVGLWWWFWPSSAGNDENHRKVVVAGDPAKLPEFERMIASLKPEDYGLVIATAARTHNEAALAVISRHGISLDYNHGSALNDRARIGDLEGLQMLIRNGASIKVNESGQLAASVVAIAYRHYDVAYYLLDQGANPNIANGTLLMDAVEFKNPSLVKALLDHGARTDLPRPGAALDYAKEHKLAEIVKLLESKQ
jgi:hypothetical protein